MESLAILFHIGPFGITRTVVTSWGILLLLGVGSWLATRRLVIEQPGLWQTALEGAVQSVESGIASVAPERAALLAPFVGTLWLFVAVANLTGLIPGLHAPTGDLSTTAALAIVVFLSVHWSGIRSAGLRTYLKHYLSPNPILLPFHLLGEFSRTLALAVRLFGNIMSGVFVIGIALSLAGLLVPIPFMALDLLTGAIQAYIFSVLAMVFIGAAVQGHAPPSQRKE